MLGNDKVAIPSFIIQCLKSMESIWLEGDGQILLKFTPSETFELVNEVLTIKAESKLKEVDGLVGLAGAYFNPRLLFASDCMEVLMAWDWIHERVGGTFKQLSFWLTTNFIRKLIFYQQFDLELIAPIGLAVSLHKLSNSIDVEIKLREMKNSLDGNIRYWAKFESPRIFDQADDMIRYMCNLESEIDFAILAKNRFPVELAKRPDMFVDGIGVDVKNLSWNSSIPMRNYLRKVIDRACEAFGQKAKLAVLSIGILLKLLGLVTHEELKNTDFDSELDKGLRLVKESRKPVLLFHHDPWTGKTIAQVEALKDLKKMLALRTGVRILTTVRKIPDPTIKWNGKHIRYISRLK